MFIGRRYTPGNNISPESSLLSTFFPRPFLLYAYHFHDNPPITLVYHSLNAPFMSIFLLCPCLASVPSIFLPETPRNNSPLQHGPPAAPPPNDTGASASPHSTAGTARCISPHPPQKATHRAVPQTSSCTPAHSRLSLLTTTSHPYLCPALARPHSPSHSARHTHAARLVTSHQLRLPH